MKSFEFRKFLLRFGPYLLLVAAVFAAYSNVYENWFLYDDEFLIQKNSLILSWNHFFDIFRTSSTGGSGATDSFYRPMQGLFYLITYQLFGYSEPAFHLLNILLHAGNAVLVFILGKRLGFQPKWSWAAALLWCLLPLHVEGVTYMSATADPSYTFFCLLAAVVLVPSFSMRRTLLASLFFLLGLLSKETAIVFPALALACLWIFPQHRTDKKIYLRMLIFWGIALGYLIARQTFLNFDQTFTFYVKPNIYTENMLYRFFTFLATLPSYFSLIAWPNLLSMDKPFSVYTLITTPAVLIGLLILILALGQLAWGRGQRGIALSWGILWFLAAHSPHTGVLIPVNSFFLEHWMYLPSIGLFLGVAQSLANCTEGKKILRQAMAVFALMLAAAWGVRTFLQNEVWETPVVFYNHVLKVNPQSARVHNNLGMAYAEQNLIPQAIEQYLKAIEISDVYAQPGTIWLCSTLSKTVCKRPLSI